MALTSGFYNSLNHDRLYYNDQISRIFDGIITDGIFDSIGTAMVVTALGGMDVGVGVGRAWFNGRWVNNDSVYTMPTITPPSGALQRIDTVFLVIDNTDAVRAASFEIVSGIETETDPQVPEYTNGIGENKHAYPLANINLPIPNNIQGTYEIDQSWITNRIGTDTPFITGIIDSIDVSTFLQQYQAEFENWFNALQDVLDENTATKLYNMILSNTFDYDLTVGGWEKPVGSDYWQYLIRSSTYIWTAGSSVDHPKESNQEILPRVGISKELLEMLQAANIVDGGQYMDGNQGVLKLICMGEKPTETLPIRILYRGMK